MAGYTQGVRLRTFSTAILRFERQEPHRLKVFVMSTDTWMHRPVIDYIAACNGDCGSVASTSLQWIKLDQQGWISGSNPGTWATDKLIGANNTWTVTIPSNLAAGNYVVRHEIIALHAAGSTNGAQAYPQCVNFAVTGGGSGKISGGVPATSFYKASGEYLCIGEQIGLRADNGRLWYSLQLVFCFFELQHPWSCAWEGCEEGART